MRKISAEEMVKIVEFYKNKKGSARRAKEIETSADPLKSLEDNVQKRGAGASSKTYLGYQEDKISQFLSQERMNSHEEETLVKFLQVLYREMGGSKKRTDEIFYKSPAEKTYHSFDQIIQNLFSRAIRDPKGASSKTLEILGKKKMDFLADKAQGLYVRLPEGSKNDPAPGFFKPKMLTTGTLKAYCELKSIKLDPKPVVESAVTM